MTPIRYLARLVVIVFPLIIAGCESSKPVVVKVQDETQRDAPPVPSRTDLPSLNVQYEMDVVCDNEPELRLTRVTVTDTKTICDFTYTSQTASPIGVAAPCQQTAFYIADPDTRVEYKLLNVEGNSLLPQVTNLQPSESINFILTFERISNNLTKFHIIEGKSQYTLPNGQLAET